jgi:hypothetical protein
MCSALFAAQADVWSKCSTGALVMTVCTDGIVRVGDVRLRLGELSSLLASRYAFMSGALTPKREPILSFGDSRTPCTFYEYSILVDYLLQAP